MSDQDSTVRRRYGEVAFDVDRGWSDHTIVSLLLPPLEPLPMLRARAPKEDRPSLMLTRADAAGVHFDLDDYARAQLRVLRELMPAVEQLDERSAEVRGPDGATPAAVRELKLMTPDDGVVRQLHAYFRVGDVMFTLTASGSEGASFDAVREAFDQVLGSLEVDGSTL